MTSDVETQIAEYGQQLFEEARPVSADEARAVRPGPAGVARRRPIVAVAAAALVAVASIAVWDGFRPDSDGSQPVITDDLQLPDRTPAPGGEYPSLLVIEGNRSTARFVDPFTGETVEEIAPESLGVGGLTGAGATRDGRAVLWVGPTVVVHDDGVDDDTVVPVVGSPPGSLPETDIALVDQSTRLWAAQPTTADGVPRAWLIDYVSDEVIAEPDLSGTSTVTIDGVTQSGAVVMSLDDRTEFRMLGTDGTLVHPDTTGEVVAVHSTGVLYQRCDADGGSCRLFDIAEATGESVPVDNRLVDPVGSFVSISNPKPLGSYLPIPANDPSGTRVVIGAAEHPDSRPDNPTRAVVIDLDSHAVEESSGRLPGAQLPFWSCDGTRVAVLADNQIVTHDEQRTGVEFDENEFVVGLGACPSSTQEPTSSTIPITGKAEAGGVSMTVPSQWSADTTGRIYLDQFPRTGLSAITISTSPFVLEPDRSCGQVPSAALNSVGQRGAAISVLEVPEERGTLRTLPDDRSSLLPATGDILDMQDRGCDFDPVPATFTEFAMAGRHFIITVALGVDAPDDVIDNATDALESITVQ